MELSDVIIDKIKNEGPIPFNDFMEMSLYYPGMGYYASTGESIGTNGDFYTSPCLSPVFGAMVSKQIEEMWMLMGKTEFTVVEFGAGKGSLCGHIMQYIEHTNPQLYEKLNYAIVEKSPAMRLHEQKSICRDKVCWYDSIQDMPRVQGCVVSNELVDNFAVHLVEMQDELMEVFVDYTDGFKEKLKPASEPIKQYFAEQQVSLPKGYRTEVNLEATQWIQDVSRVLIKGYVMTIDYGYSSTEIYNMQRSKGTLVCYNKHKVSAYPYADIGRQDITSHVNFTALHLWGQKNGLNLCGYTDQARFLLSLGILDHLNRAGEIYGNSDPEKEAFLKYALLVDMGRKFKVLIQGKDTPGQRLTGLMFA